MFIWNAKYRFENIANEVLKTKQLKAKQTRLAAVFQIGRLLKNFSGLSVVQISDSQWTDYILREQKRKNRKFYDDRKYMRMIFHLAKKKKLISQVPDFPIPDLPWDAGREILPEEIDALEANANEDLRFQIQIGWKMGLRLREMMHLSLEQIDPIEKCLVLRAGETKTRTGRKVPIPESLWPEFSKRMRRSCDLGSPCLFPSPIDIQRPQDNNKTAWRRCKAKAGVEARWHDLRHTCATVMLRRGVAVHVARRYLGNSEAVMLRIYIHLSLADLRIAANVMNYPTQIAS